ncbi:uncharacterized protein JCM15063_006122 [Sporobolomyces koalae]|uniref:uncharacterized protein n=1 Tax=Sporobolomyces koalae TaxID=500713 RepID=UPI00317A3725
MAFLRKWGSSATSGIAAPNPSAPNGLGSGIGGTGAAGKDALGTEWHTETPGERYFGMENFGNTCYANSVLQSLYFARPFRQLVESYQPYSLANTQTGDSPDSASLAPPASTPTPPLDAQPATSSPVPSPTALRPTPPPARSAGGGGRGGIFSRQRQGSMSTATSDSSSPPIGTPLTHTVTNSSFTGVGQPVVQNGALAREVSGVESTLLTALRDLFAAISAQPKSTGTVAPQAFINQLKRDNEFFRSTLHQDAHEFLNFLVNALAEILEKEEKRRAEDEGRAPSLVGTGFGEHAKTWVHSLFEGILTNETRCLTCETTTSRDEAFLDLSIDIEQNSSVTSCLRQFSASEMLCQRNKFSCDKCCGLQEAEKRMKVKKLPNLLALHLKRFKYEESLQRHVKLTYRVVFPFELRLFNTTDDISNPDRLYELWAIVVHIGVGPTHGHYITIVKSGSKWIVFDDNNVYPIEQAEIARYFGDTPGQGSAYCLFYQAVDLDSPFSGLPPQATAGMRPRTMTTSSVSTGGATGTSAFTKLADEPPPIPPLPPASVEAKLPSPSPPSFDPLPPVTVPAALVDPTAALESPKARHTSLPPLNVESPSPQANGTALPSPSPSRQHRKPSLASLSSSAGGDRDAVEKSGWSLKGRFARTKSQAAPSRSTSSASTPAGLANANPETDADARVPPETDSGTTSSLPSAVPPEPPLADTATGPTSDPLASKMNGLPAFASPARTFSTLPKEDDRDSTTSRSAIDPSQSPVLVDRRRDSRLSASEDLLSSSTSSATASPHLAGTLPPPAAAASSSNGPLSATRNLFSRSKPRPLSSSGRPSLTPSSPLIGTGLGLSTGPPNAAPPAPNQDSPTLRRASITKRLSTTGPVAQAAASDTPASAPRTVSNSTGHANGSATHSSGSSTTESSGPLPPPVPLLPPPLTKKEAEKRLKEERKAREQELKAREKQQKEQLKQMKEEAKRQEKLRRKMSVKG